MTKEAKRELVLIEAIKIINEEIRDPDILNQYLTQIQNALGKWPFSMMNGGSNACCYVRN